MAVTCYHYMSTPNNPIDHPKTRAQNGKVEMQEKGVNLTWSSRPDWDGKTLIPEQVHDFNQHGCTHCYR